MIRFVAGLAFASCLLATALLPASAQDARQNEPGKFDFYVLSLSWSPSFCAAAQDSGRSGGAQCGARPYSFVVHGLWPQYEKGFPEYCEQPSPRLYHGIMESMLDLMPAPHLIYNEWDKHGTCSGLSARAYFETIRKARTAVKIPPDYVDLKDPLNVAPDAVRDAELERRVDHDQAGSDQAGIGARRSHRYLAAQHSRHRQLPQPPRQGVGRVAFLDRVPQLDADLKVLLPALAEAFSPQAACRIDWLAAAR